MRRQRAGIEHETRWNYTLHESPLGALLLAGDAAGLRLLNFQQGKHPEEIPPHWQEDAAFFAETTAQLDAYFERSLERFELTLAPIGTPFQQQVWNELQRIPFGTTISYKELAERIRRPESVRAVGGANGANPIALIIPCHRVIGVNGKLTGYGGGIEIKERLLAHEGALLSL